MQSFIVEDNYYICSLKCLFKLSYFNTVEQKPKQRIIFNQLNIWFKEY